MVDDEQKSQQVDNLDGCVLLDLVGQTDGQKHKRMLAFLYTVGLRVQTFHCFQKVVALSASPASYGNGVRGASQKR